MTVETSADCKAWDACCEQSLDGSIALHNPLSSPPLIRSCSKPAVPDHSVRRRGELVHANIIS